MQACPIKLQPAGLPFVLPALWFTMQATEVHGTPTLAPGATVIGYPSRATWAKQHTPAASRPSISTFMIHINITLIIKHYSAYPSSLY